MERQTDAALAGESLADLALTQDGTFRLAGLTQLRGSPCPGELAS
jgi:hypothetical protein